MGKSWLKKDFSELRKEQKEKPKKKRSISIEVKRELPIPKEKPKPKRGIQSYTVKVWAKRDDDPWKFMNIGKQELDEFVNAVERESEGYVKLGKRALINLNEVTIIRIIKVEE